MERKKVKIIWVFGGSGAGKETFIRHLQLQKPESLLERLGWSGKSLSVCEESLNWVVQYDNDPNGPQREELLELIQEYVQQKPDILLIKGQDLDLENNRLRRLKSFLPNDEHSIIYISTDLEEQFERWKSSKVWYKEEYDLSVVEEWQRHQLKYLAELKEEFKILSLFGGKGKEYIESPLPKELL